MHTGNFGDFDSGFLATGREKRDVASLPWVAHKEFTGVFLKNIITPDDTQNTFTCHLVRIEPGCAIGLHTHPSSLELHEVMAGEGVCVVPDGEIPYTPGIMAIMPQNAPHEVKAGAAGLCLLAKFITAGAESSAA